MSKMIQVRNVPDERHRTLKSRAALDGKSLSDYLVAEIRLLAERPSPAELRRRLSGRKRVRVSRQPADVVREERDARSCGRASPRTTRPASPCPKRSGHRC